MKTLKTLGLLLLVATGLMAQPNPDNMFIDGYVLNASGQAVANQVVCVYYTSSNPALPSDSLCTTTNNNGYYFLDVQNGSLSGPNVNFEVSTYDPCSFLPLTQTVMNGQGTIDTATVNFSVCANGNGCTASIQLDSSVFGPVLIASSTGAGPFEYTWNTGETTAQISGLTPDSTYCVTIADNNGCVATECYYFGVSNGCSVEINAVQSPNTPFVYTLTANASGVAPFTYLWDNNQTAQSVTYSYNQQGIYGACVTVTDATGCTVTDCDTLVVDTNSTGNCSASFYYLNQNPNNPIMAGDTVSFYFNGSLANTNYYFWSVQGMGLALSSQNMNPHFIFPAPGTYNVCVEVYDSLINCSDTECISIYVDSLVSTGCNAAFSSTGPTPIGYTFTAQVQNPNLHYYWEIDNQYVGNGYDAQAPGLTNGVHTVCLTVIDSLNMCSDQQCQSITVGNNVCSGYVSGQVYAGSNNQPLDEGVVYLITYDANTNQLTAVDSMVIDSGYWFSFGPLSCGDYLIKAAASAGSQYSSGHVPTYYGNSPFWSFAQTISLTQANTQVTADVTLIAANNPGGPGFIGGDVTQGANKTEGDPLSGVEVLLLDMSNNAITYAYTDANGEFGFDDLAYGTYQVYVEKLGVQTIAAVVTIGPDQPSVEDVHILVSESLISTGISEFDFDGAISDVYPNPVGNDASINFNLEADVMMDIQMVDLTGRIISTQSVSVGSGTNTVNINVENLDAGHYFLNIQDVNGAFSITRKFMRVD